MLFKYKFPTALLFVLACLSFLPAGASAQTANIQSRITQQVNDSQRTVLRGNTHPLARPQYDHGSAPACMELNRMMLVLKRSPAQETALQSLLAEQQDKSSPNYHKWLTPAQFGQLFGASDQDIQKISSWLTMHGFLIDNVANGRQIIQFSGTAGEVEEAFQTPIHSYIVNGEQHWANTTDPSIPTALTPVVAGVRSLHNFFPKPMHRVRLASKPKAAAGAKPNFTFPAGTNGCNVLSSPNCYGVGPTDLATIYNITPLLNGGINGTGVTIAIMSDSNINLQDVSDFRSQFGLPVNVPVVTIPPGSSDPGVQVNGDEIEAILDVEWSGAVAQGATINLVTSASSGTTFGGDLSAEYVVDFPNSTHTSTSTGFAPILSESFGECELGLGTSGNTFYNTLWSQAATEGITVLVSAGDNGSSGCDVQQVSGPPTQAAEFGLAVNGIASTPFNVAVGGTDFNDFNNFCASWNPCNGSNNNPITGASAISYIPETTWNDSCTNSVFITGFNSEFGSDAQTVCNNATIEANGLVVPVGASGGKSACTTSDGSTVASCAGGNPKPTFQDGVSPSTDTTRDIPDVSMFAGDGEISSSFYIVCERDFSGIDGQACNLDNGVFLSVGGTSVSTQVFAGVMALVVQKNSLARQGDANNVMYSLAKAEFASNCNANSPPPGTCVFNDVTTGTIAMPCASGSVDCIVNAAGVQPVARQVKRPTITTLVTLVCVLCVGVLLICFRGTSRIWTTAIGLLAIVAFTVNAGCGGSGNGGGGGGGGGTVAFGVESGYNAGTGYDLATGLGSVNVTNLVNASGWATAVPPNVPNVGTPIAPSLARRLQDRDWQPAGRAIAMTFAFCLGILLLGYRQRSRRTNAAMTVIALAFLMLTAGLTRVHGLGVPGSRGAVSANPALARSMANRN